nr:DUF4197 domain-containing protein [Geofilum rubicundum]
MKRRIYLFILSAFLLSSCAELLQVVQTIDTERPLTQTEVVSGLKEALKIGTDSAASRLARQNGYYGDQAVKILLPPEAAVIVNNVHRLPGGEKMLEDLILRINRSAEDAAREAGPVFYRAITQMSIQDGFGILRGEQDAATSYLKNNTYQQLFNLYQPKLKTSLDKKLIAGVSTNQSWETLTTQWNRLAGSLAGQVAGLNKVEVELDTYLTDKALEACF